MNRQFFLMLSLVVGIGMVFSACQRSPQYRKEEDFGRTDQSSNFLPSSAEGLTQKAESIGQPKKRVLVLNFWNSTPIKQNQLGTFSADELKRGLMLTQRVLMPIEQSLDLSTEDFLQGDQIKVAQLIREGHRAGVAVLVIGRISKILFRQKGDEIGVFRQKQSLAAVELEAKIFDVQSGREVVSISKIGEAANSSVIAVEEKSLESPAFRAELTRFATREAVAGFIPEVVRTVDKITWEGRIAKLLGPKVFVNAGRASGLNAGDILKVLTPGEDIYDAASGAYLGKSHGLLKGTLEVVDFLGTDGAVAEIHTGGNFKESDLVQLY